MLIAPLYHKVGTGKYANPLEMLQKHFAYIAAHFPTVLPGEPLPRGTAVCLTFDDATFDFFHLVFPLLQTYSLKAVLAVPTAFIPDSTPLTPKERLEKVASLPSKPPPLPSSAFCSWEELKILSESPLIQLASHSIHHRPMTSKQIDPQREFILSKKILEERVQKPIETFVYPYGLFNRQIHQEALKHYTHIFRIGNAANLSWKNTQGLLYRTSADALPSPSFPFTLGARLSQGSRFLLNTVRRR